jgi:hypothetical protein
MAELTFCTTSGGIVCMLCVTLAWTEASCMTSSLEDAPFSSNPHFMPMSLHLNSYAVNFRQLILGALIRAFTRCLPAVLSCPTRTGERRHNVFR